MQDGQQVAQAQLRTQRSVHSYRPNAGLKAVVIALVALVVGGLVLLAAGPYALAFAILLLGLPVILPLMPVRVAFGLDGISVGEGNQSRFYPHGEVQRIQQTSNYTLLTYTDGRQLKLFLDRQRPLDDGILYELRAFIANCKNRAAVADLLPYRADASLVDWMQRLLVTPVAADREALGQLARNVGAPIDQRAVAAALLRYNLDRSSQALLMELAEHTTSEALRAVFLHAAAPMTPESLLTDALRRVELGPTGLFERLSRLLRGPRTVGPMGPRGSVY